MSIGRLAISSGVCAGPLLFARSGLMAQPQDSAYLKTKVTTVDLLAGKTTTVSQTLKSLPLPKGP